MPPHGNNKNDPKLSGVKIDAVKVKRPTNMSNTAPSAAEASRNVIDVTDFCRYTGSSLEDQLATLIQEEGVVMISKSYCPFCLDAKELLAGTMGVKVHCIEINQHPDGSTIYTHLKTQSDHKTVPMIFIKGEFIGGCDNLKALHAKGTLEGSLLAGMQHDRPRYEGANRLEPASSIPTDRSRPLFWFPNTVNNYTNRVIGFQTFVLSILSAVLDEPWGRYMAVFVLFEFIARFLAGASASVCGTIAILVTSPFRPQIRPGPPKQFAAACGIMFSGLGTLFYFLEFEGHEYVGCIFMAGLAGAAGLEWALDYCLGCKFYAIGIYLGTIPNRIYTSTHQEIEDASKCGKPENGVHHDSKKIK